MRITKLHFLIFLLLIGLTGGYFYRQRRQEQKKKEQELQRAEALRKAQEEEFLRKQTEVSAPVPQPSPEPEKKEPAEILYTVQRGDTLWSIAKKSEHFGEGNRWYDIWKANEDKIFDFDHIVAGQELVIPLDKPKGYAWPLTSQEKKEKLLKRKMPARTKTVPTN